MDSLSMSTASTTRKNLDNLTLNSAFPLHDIFVLQNMSGLLTEDDTANMAQMGKEKEQLFAVFLKHLDNYVLPAIILLGIVGNIISFTGEYLHLLRQLQ